MSGLVKAKKYDWKDSNLAMFGSDTEKEVKKESAEAEPAWQGAGQEPGLKIWRIVDFQVTEWPVEDYGEFYNGDSYIILKTYKDDETEQLLHDVHFWIGKNSSQDEYGTAAYKTVELDTFLDDVPVQHREVQGHESQLFKSYFDEITLKEGGAATGFRSVPAEEYKPRLFKFSKDANGSIVVKQRACAASVVTEDDVFILDKGITIYQYNGDDSSIMERSKAMQYIGKIKSTRGEAQSEVLDGSGTSKLHDFWETLTEEEEEDPDSDDEEPSSEKKLLKVNTESKESEVVLEGDYSRDNLVSDDVFLLDTGKSVIVWVGSSASGAEKKNGLPYAHNYLRESGQPWLPITVIREGQKSAELESALAA